MPTFFNLERIVGRQVLVDDLVERLILGQSPALSTNGMGAVGKTTVAILLAYHPRIRSHFQDSVLWAGVGPIPDIAGIQAGWALALGVQVENITDLELRQQIIIRGLAGRRVLVVLDDVWQPEAANVLRCGLPGVGHLLTTRSEAVARSFAGSAQSVRVPLLDENSAWRLLQDLAPEACESDPRTARALADSVGGLPLAIELLGGYLGQVRAAAAHVRVFRGELSAGAPRGAAVWRKAADANIGVFAIWLFPSHLADQVLSQMRENPVIQFLNIFISVFVP